MANMKKRTKIVCTVGPASAKVTTLTSMMKAGMNVARLNLSHGTHEGHKKLIRNIRMAAKRAGEPVAILADLQGPKIRLGNVPEEGVVVKKGETITLSTRARSYNDGVFPVTYSGLHKDVKKGHRILIDDGLLELKVTQVKGANIKAKVVNGGKITSHKGMNFPDTTLSLSSITRKDRKDIKFAVEQDVDWIAISFVTGTEDIKTLRRLIKLAAKKDQPLPRVIVKIEKHEAIENFYKIVSEVDGVMVARGDLGIEIVAAEVPIRQKEIIDACRHLGKPVVVATQMLDSMIRNPRPTRAEVSDVANAVFDHADAVMLSGETATGKYPVKAVKIMTKIIKEAEASPYDDVGILEGFPDTEEGAVAYALKILAMSGYLDAIVTSNACDGWGETFLMGHPEIPLFLFSTCQTGVRQANIRWGVRPIYQSHANPKTFLQRSMRYLLKHRELKKGARVAVVYQGRHGLGFDLVRVQ